MVTDVKSNVWLQGKDQTKNCKLNNKNIEAHDTCEDRRTTEKIQTITLEEYVCTINTSVPVV